MLEYLTIVMLIFAGFYFLGIFLDDDEVQSISIKVIIVLLIIVYLMQRSW